MGAGVVLFVIVNGSVYLAANPRFPNQEGPMPRALPYQVLGFLVVLGLAAWKHAGWRRVAFGFLIGFVGTTILTLGACTVTWPAMAVALDPTREPRRLARLEAARESAWRVELPKRIAEVRSEKGRAYLARTLGEAAHCAFTYRDAHPDRGFPVSLQELGVAGDDCGQFAGALSGGRWNNSWTVALVPPPAATLPVTSLRLRIAPSKNLGIDYPQLELDERGFLTMRDASTAPPHVVASPVPALLALRECVSTAVPSPYRSDPLSLMSLLGTTGPSCATLAKQTMRNGDTMELAVRLDSRVAGRDESPGAQYVVHYLPRRERPSEGFVLSAESVGVGSPRRHYLVALDGSVHATSESRDATETDPPPEACEADPTIACR
jgi:hypothetical protein